MCKAGIVAQHIVCLRGEGAFRCLGVQAAGGHLAAAYHSGWGTVDALLQMEEHSADGETLQGFPYNQMNHYVKKITSCYARYQRIYAES